MAAPHQDLIGLTVRDRVTGYTGMVTSQTRYLAGCDRIEVRARVRGDGKLLEPGWFDVLTVEVVEGGPTFRPSVPQVVGG